LSFCSWFQLVLLDSSGFFVMTFGGRRQRENFRPVDPLLVGDFPGVVVSRQFQYLIGRTSQ
jgi:hypothetical protein